MLFALVLFVPILGGSVPNIGFYLCWWISEIRWCRLKRAIIIMIDQQKKHKTLSYISALTVIDSRMCTTSSSAMCGSRGVQSGHYCCAAQAFKYQLKKRLLCRSDVSSANSSDNVYLTPTYDFACNLASSGALCGVSELHLSG